MTETVNSLSRVPSAFKTRDKIPRERNEYSNKPQAQAQAQETTPENYQKERRLRKESSPLKPKDDTTTTEFTNSLKESKDQNSLKAKDLERVPSAFKKRDKIRNTFTPSSLDQTNTPPNNNSEEPENFHYAFARRDKVRVTFTGSNIKKILEGQTKPHAQTQPQSDKQFESEVTTDSILESYIDQLQEDKNNSDKLDSRQSIISEEMGEVVVLQRGKSIKSNTIRLDENMGGRVERVKYSRASKLNGNQIAPQPQIFTISEISDKEFESTPNPNDSISNPTDLQKQSTTVKHEPQTNVKESDGCCTIL